MKIYNVEIASNSPIAFGRNIRDEVESLDRESPADYEKRTWMHKAHVNDGSVFIPALAFKNGLEAAAKYSGEKITGARGKTWTAKFASGVLVVKNVAIGKSGDLKPLWLFVPSDGKKGGKSRVNKCFPTLDRWTGTLEVHVLDEIVTKDKLKETLIEMGNYIGLGSLRIQNGGILGRFTVGAVTEVKAKSATA
jgi:hypothetical protein